MASPGELVSGVGPGVPGLLGDEPGPVVDTDLAVVPIDPREVLWAVGRMIELCGKSSLKPSCGWWRRFRLGVRRRMA